MKLYLIIQSMDGGGAQRVLSHLANYWSSLGHSIVLATLKNECSFYILNRDIKHIKLGLDSKSIKEKKILFDNLFRVKTIAKSIEDEKVDVVISFMTTANILAIVASKFVSVPIIISERTNYNFLNSKIWRVLRRVVYPFSDSLIVLSSYDKKKYSFHNNCHIIYNPISISQNHQCIKRENIILAVGRLEYLKGFDMLIEAFSRVDSNGGWKVIIVGEGDDRKELEELILKKGLDNVIEMPGESQDMEKYYKRASIFVLSSRIEGFPNVLIEAMAYGCASIAIDCLTGPRDIIRNKENGLLVEIENIDALSKAITSLINNSNDIEKYAQNAKKIEAELVIKRISDIWLKVISTVIIKKRG